MQSLTFKRIEDAEGDDNRGWQIDKVVPMLDGKEVGYLNMSYIPRARFMARYTAGVLSYCDLMEGHCLFDRSEGRGGKSHDIASFDDETLRLFVRRAAWTFLHRDFSMGDELAAMDRSAMLALVSTITERATLLHQNKFDAFRRFHVDKPLVDFIRVDDELQGRGIGLALYAEGAKWMAEKRMQLRSSSLQSTGAPAAWRKMEALGWVLKGRKRRRIDASKIKSVPAIRPLPVRELACSA